MNQETDQKGNILIGEGVKASGTFHVPGKAMINGALDGELTADELTVGPHGKLMGRVQVRRADVYGESYDSITASEHLIIRSTGQIHGVAAYGHIEIERGGSITGTVAPVGTSNPAKPRLPASGETPHRPAANT